jgi:hypothetical protein
MMGREYLELEKYIHSRMYPHQIPEVSESSEKRKTKRIEFRWKEEEKKSEMRNSSEKKF